MSLEQLTLSDEQVQDIVASLITSGNNADTVYDDVNDTLTVSLTDSISVNTLEATTSITDPEGNTVTSLSDPVRVTEEASTFTASNVTVINNNTQVSNGSIDLAANVVNFFPDDFEDGVDSEWVATQGSLSDLTTTTSPALSQGQSGKIALTDASAVYNYSLNSTTSDNIGMRVNIQGDQSSISSFDIDLKNSNSSPKRMVKLVFEDDPQQIDYFDGSTNNVLQSWSKNTTFDIKMQVGSNQEVTFIINGTSYGPFSTQNGENQYDVVSVRLDARKTTSEKRAYIDNLANKLSNGDALVAFDSGAPADIDSYDLATFQRTLDGETVTVDVEDSTGTVLKSDISKDTDISDIATSKDVQLRANLSRNDTANNPTVDYLARRFTR